jgi:hypothetical protein
MVLAGRQEPESKEKAMSIGSLIVNVNDRERVVYTVTTLNFRPSLGRRTVGYVALDGSRGRFYVEDVRPVG